MQNSKADWSNNVSWNYRVVHRPGSEDTCYSIHEVYYDDEGRVTLYSVAAIAAMGDTVEECQYDLSLMHDAFNLDPLNLNYVDHLIKVRKGILGLDKKYK